MLRREFFWPRRLKCRHGSRPARKMRNNDKDDSRLLEESYILAQTSTPCGDEVMAYSVMKLCSMPHFCVRRADVLSQVRAYTVHRDLNYVRLTRRVQGLTEIPECDKPLLMVSKMPVFM